MKKEKFFLLENINASGIKVLEEGGYSVEAFTESIDETELVEKANEAEISGLGIRSKTQINKGTIEKIKTLKAIGTFCIGTNQVDLDSAMAHGVPVFNAPYSNTRSVAELVLCEMIALSRKLFYLSDKTHKGVWNKSASGSYEIRGKTVGIVGYGHIGTQVGLLCEALGMNVVYYDVEAKLPLGMAKPCLSLSSLMKQSDFVTLHVPETEETKNMITKSQLKLMKEGSYLINASRGTVVDLADLSVFLKENHLAGAAIDVYPKEPRKNGPGFESELLELDNVILTPHIGGSTEEAQVAIGKEVSSALDRYIKLGDTMGAVNFPQLRAPAIQENTLRLCHIHQNTPGVLGKVNTVFSNLETNILYQSLATHQDIGYLIADFSKSSDSEALLGQIMEQSFTIKARVL